MTNLDSFRCWRCMLCPCKVRNKFLVTFWNRTILCVYPVYYKYLFRTSCNITTSANNSRINLHIIVSCCGLEFQFLSVLIHSRLPSRSTLSTFYVPNPPSLLGYNKPPPRNKSVCDCVVVKQKLRFTGLSGYRLRIGLSVGCVICLSQKLNFIKTALSLYKLKQKYPPHDFCRSFISCITGFQVYMR